MASISDQDGGNLTLPRDRTGQRPNLCHQAQHDQNAADRASHDTSTGRYHYAQKTDIEPAGGTFHRDRSRGGEIAGEEMLEASEVCKMTDCVIDVSGLNCRHSFISRRQLQIASAGLSDGYDEKRTINAHCQHFA
jgi:hypothetical protein